jgi:cytochrome c-type biogenesis protein CcmH/NrfF
MRQALCCTVFVLATLLGIRIAKAEGEPAEWSPAVRALAHELEKRLMAPCCWRETLDTHVSPIAEGLRREIRTRIAKGEPPFAIEADLIRRYGSGLRATLPENLGYVLFGFACVFGIVILWFMVRKTPESPDDPHLGVLRLGSREPRISPEELRRLESLLDDDLADEPS